MDNNWRPTPPGGEASMDTGDWRSQLQPDSRQRIVNKIMDTLKRHLPFSGQEGLNELKKIAARFEEKIFTAATSQTDYLRKISLKMLTMESKSQNPLPNSMPSNNPGNTNKPPDQGASMQNQLQCQGPSIPMSLPADQPQARQQPLSTGGQGSSGLPSVLSSVSSLTHTTIPSVVGQNPNVQNSISQNSVSNAMGQGVPSSLYANQRQMQGRPQVLSQQQQQQTQTPQQSYIYQQQLQQQLLKQKFQQQQGNPSHSLMQSHLQQQQQQQQQQNLLQPNQLQSSQQTSSVVQPSGMQSAPLSNLQQNQQSSVQQSTQSMIQQHSQSVLRPQQQLIHQQQTPMAQSQQPMMGQQSNSANMQNNLPNLQQQQQQQQQQLMAQQNISNMHHQQMGSQSNVSGLQQQSGSSGMQTNQQAMHSILQQSKVPMQQQTSQQSQPNLLPNQGQQSQAHPSQQQMMSQIQSQPSQLQQQFGMQQQPTALQRDMQRLQASGSLLQQKNVTDQQKQQLYQQQRAPPETSSTSLDSTAGQPSGGDWQEEVYQKIKVMKETYLPEVNEMYQRIATKLQHHDSLPQAPKSEQLDKLKIFKSMLERIKSFLNSSKNNVLPSYRDKLGSYEKQIVNFLNTNRTRKPVSSIPQGQLPPSHMQSAQPQQPQSQVSHDSQMSPQMQSMNLQGSMATMQQNSMTSMPHNAMSSLSGVSTVQQTMLNSLQPGTNAESGQGNSLNSLQQVPMGSIQQNSVSAPQQANINTLSSQSGVNMMPSNMNPLQSNSNMLQHQHHMKQQQEQMLQSHQLKQQLQQRQMQQQIMQKQQLLQQQQHQQQQQLHQQAKQQQLTGQMATHQMPQLHAMNDLNDLKMRQGMGAKSGVFQQHLSSGQRSTYSHQQMKSGASFPISSPQLLQAASPQMAQHSSPQVDQQSLLSSVTKTGTPLQSANSPFVVPSPSTPMAPSPMPGDSEKPTSGASTLSNVGNIAHQQTTSAQTAAPSLAIGTPGISASPLLAEFSVPDGTHGNVPTTVSGKSSLTEQPLERLLKAVKSMSSKALGASVSDIGSVVSMTDRIAGSAPGNGSRAAVGEDLVAMTKCRLQARNFITQDGVAGPRKMRRYTSAMPLTVVSSAGSVNDSFKQLSSSETSDLESTATSSAKRPRHEANHALLEEIREINQRLIDTVVDISDEDVDPSAAAEGGEGTIVKCSFSAIALSPNLKSQYASAQMSPILPLRLLVPTNYPNCSPILLDKFPVEVSKEHEDLSVKAKSRFSISLRSLSQPMSLGEIARTWDVCARAVISEYAQQSGGGSFSSQYGTWENCLSAA